MHRAQAVFVWTETEVQCVSSDSHAILYLQRIKEFDLQKTVRISTHAVTGPDAAEDGKHYMVSVVGGFSTEK